MRRPAAIVAFTVLASACAKPASPSQAPPPAAEPARVDVAPRGPPVAVDVTLALAPDQPHIERVEVPAGDDVIIDVAHVSGALGRIAITVREQRPGEPPDTTIPALLDDAMTCAEPGCSYRVRLRAGNALAPVDRAHTLEVSCAAPVAMQLHVTLTSEPHVAD